MTSKNRDLLAKLMQVLIEEWGFDEVNRAIAQTLEMAPEARTKPSGEQKFPRTPKATALEQARKLVGSDSELEPLIKLAIRFDRKEFLPSIADARDFLAMMGEVTGNLKNRSDAFRALLGPLSQLPFDRLERLANSTHYSGPASLGPLADAIRSAGHAMRRADKPANGEQEQKVTSEKAK